MVANSIVPLKDLCKNFKEDIVDGPFGANLKREHYQQEGIPVLKIQNIKPFSIVLKKMDFVTENKYQDLKRHSYQKGDIIMTKLGDPLGESAIVEGIDDGLIVADLVRIRAQKIDTKYLCYHLNSPVTNAFINSQQKGTTRPRVRISVVRELPIYAPPIPEQKRIVAILDQAFADIDRARELTERNLHNARELFESYLQQVFSQSDEGWENKTLSDVCQFENGDRGKNYPSRSKFVETGKAFINAGHIDDGYIDFTKMNFITEETFNLLSKGKIRKGDVLFCLRGSLGKFAVVSNDTQGAIASSLVIIRPQSGLSIEFLLHYLRSGLCKKMIDQYAGGTAQPNLGAKDLAKFFIGIPSVTEQKHVADQLDKLMSEVERLEHIYADKLQELYTLKKSLLQKAFSGKLTQSDQEAA